MILKNRVRRIPKATQLLLVTKTEDNRFTFFAKQLLMFGWLQTISCIFPLIIFLSLGASYWFTQFGIARYDFLLMMCIVAQCAMYKLQLETLDEVYVITLFHLLGLIMELHKCIMALGLTPKKHLRNLLVFPYMLVLCMPV